MQSHQLRRLASIACTVLLLLAFVATSYAKDSLVYFGTYTGGKSSKGIYVSRLDAKTGKLSTPELAAETPNPSFITLAPDGKFLYAATGINEFNGEKTGAVSAFSVDAASGKLTLLNQKSSGGDGPCHVRVDTKGKIALVANYGSGSVKSFLLKPDGSIGDGGTFIQHHGSSVNTNRQAGPHAHCIVPDPSNRFALACDLGTDKVMIYTLNPTSAELDVQSPLYASVPPGAGARHIAFRPDGKFAYVINEMACSMTAFLWNSTEGKLTALETVPLLPKGVEVVSGYSGAEVDVHPSGKFVYGSLRGHDSLSVLAADEKTGKLTLVENVSSNGKVPRCFGIDPTGRWLICANQKSDSVTVFSINPKTGKLTATGQELQVGAPVCVKFL